MNPAGSRDEAGILPNMVSEARVQVGWMGLSGWGKRQGLCP